MTISRREMVMLKYRIIYNLNHALFLIVIGMHYAGELTNSPLTNNCVFSFRAKHDDERAEDEPRAKVEYPLSSDEKLGSLGNYFIKIKSESSTHRTAISGQNLADMSTRYFLAVNFEHIMLEDSPISLKVAMTTNLMKHALIYS